MTSPTRGEIIDFLKEAGFPDDRISLALNATNASSIEDAMNWLLLEQEEGHHITSAGRPHSITANTPTSQPPPNFFDISQLLQQCTPPPRIKMVLVVRSDLKMGVGKIAAQCGHATLGLYKDIEHSKNHTHLDYLKQWELCAEPKIALKVPDYAEMKLLDDKASLLKVPSHIVYDAGKTQIPAGSATVLSILGPVDVIDSITGHLRLL